MPKVSVIIPSHNRAHFLGRAIQSVLNQTYHNFEIVVVDDGSTDDTREVIEGFGASVHYFYQPHNGVSAARNYGIKVANGEYVAFLDSDDEFMPLKLEKQVSYLDTHPNVGMVYSSYIIVDGETNQSFYSSQSLFSGWVFRELLWKCMQGPLTTPTVMVKRSVFEQVGLFDETMDLAEDIDLWCRISRRFEITSLPEALSRIHHHPGNISTDTPPNRNLAAWLHIVEKAFREDNQLDFVYKQRLYARIYQTTWQKTIYKKRYWQAAKYLLRGLSYWPFSLDLLRYPVYCLRVRHDRGT
ncbi:MAG: glycosyltransferase [Anaerolineae bacterium]|nr:glycosyltransferase [Anaerolineae bacterium]